MGCVMQILIQVSVFPVNCHFDGAILFFGYFHIKEGDGVLNFAFIGELYAACMLDSDYILVPYYALFFFKSPCPIYKVEQMIIV